ATRAAALDAHATELRRIERSLHDGTQDRIGHLRGWSVLTRQPLRADTPHPVPFPPYAGAGAGAVRRTRVTAGKRASPSA
ncbi:hypothetical protein, partial [Streptomyces sp. NPDC090994]|uniref:hypothetical protein n=1 Tax=Streptomyces sp. NPDC090994 TaxID=3365969 RepID=UPI0038145C5D